MNDKWLDRMVNDSPNAKYIAWAGELVFAGAREDDRIGRTAKFDITRAPEEAGKANPFAEHTRRRANHAGTRFTLALTEVEQGTEWIDEVMLLGWNDGPKGQTVTLLLQSHAHQHPFMHTDRNTKYAAVFVELGDDDVAVNQQKRTLVERGAQKQSNAAAQIIKNPHYWEWTGAKGVGAADQYLKGICGIESKAQLDSDPEAVRLFRMHLDQFVAWQEENGYL